MKPFIRTLFVSLINGLASNAICFGVSAFFSLVPTGIAEKLGNSGEFIKSYRSGIMISTIVATIIISAVLGAIALGHNSGRAKLYWARRLDKRKKGVKFKVIILTIIPHFLLFVAGILFLEVFNGSLAEFAAKLNDNKPALAYAWIYTAVLSVTVHQLIYCIVAFVHFYEGKCKKCGNVFCLKWSRTGSEDELSHRTKREVATTKDYYAGEGIFKGTVRSRKRDYVYEKNINVKTTYGVYNCRCVYCGHTVKKKEFEGSKQV